MSRLILLVLLLGVGSELIVPLAYLVRDFARPAAVLLLAWIAFWIIARSGLGPRS